MPTLLRRAILNRLCLDEERSDLRHLVDAEADQEDARHDAEPLDTLIRALCNTLTQR